MLLPPAAMKTRSVWAFVCGFTALTLSIAPAAFAQDSPALLPNLVPLPVSDLRVVVDSGNGHTLLLFGATNWNNGLGPLELRAGSGSKSKGQDVYQRIYYEDGTSQDFKAGTFVYHPSHNHFHFSDFARYELRAVGGAPGSEQASSKTSFCVIDTTHVDPDLSGSPQTAFYTACSPTVQGISVGWGDTYSSSIPGQSFDITGLPEADYDLTIITDPNNRLQEINETDNVSCVRLHINPSAPSVGEPGACSGAPPPPPPGGGTVTISGMDPRVIKPGETLPVTISGSGFLEGMVVALENGSGPAPTIQVISISSDSISASITAPKGGSKSPRDWDLRVDQTVLSDALTIQP
jgi:hypothetical protein